MASGNDLNAARGTYEGFVGVIKWATPLVAVIAFFVVYLLAH